VFAFVPWSPSLALAAEEAPSSAEEAPGGSAAAATDPPAAGDAEEEAADRGLLVGGFIETYGSWNTNNPANGITAWRFFDSRHATFTLSLASIHVEVQDPVLRGKVALQTGQTALGYFLAEPDLPGTAGVPPTSAASMHVIREAWVGGHLDVAAGLDVDAGVFLTPAGSRDGCPSAWLPTGFDPALIGTG